MVFYHHEKPPCFFSKARCIFRKVQKTGVRWPSFTTRSRAKSPASTAWTEPRVEAKTDPGSKRRGTWVEKKSWEDHQKTIKIMGKPSKKDRENHQEKIGKTLKPSKKHGKRMGKGNRKRAHLMGITIKLIPNHFFKTTSLGPNLRLLSIVFLAESCWIDFGPMISKRLGCM